MYFILIFGCFLIWESMCLIIWLSFSNHCANCCFPSLPKMAGASGIVSFWELVFKKMICLVYELLRTTCFPLLEACLPGIHFPFGLPCSLTQWLVRNSDSCFQRAKSFSCPNLAKLITTVSVKVKGASPLPVVRLRKDEWLILGCKTSVVWQLPLVIKKYRDFVEQRPCKCGLWRVHFCAGTIFLFEQSRKTLAGDCTRG